MKKPVIYNDGFVSVYRKREENLTMNRNVTSLDDLDYIIRLAYSETSRRQQDLEFAEQNSFSLSLKIKTQKPVMNYHLDASCYAVIGSTLYAIQYIDTNSTEYYFYLEKVRMLKEVCDESE